MINKSVHIPSCVECKNKTSLFCSLDNEEKQVGVCAQEVEEVLPEIIKPAPVDSKYKTVQYEKLIPLLIEGIKDLSKQVSVLKQQLSNNN